MSSATRPRFSLVSAVHDVEAYLPDLIASLEAQTRPLDDVEIIMVDDGSTDGSRALLEAWAARRPDLVRVLSQPNAGQGAARNAGMVVATGEWISFPDADDTLAPGYLAAVEAFVTEHPDADLVATKRLMWPQGEAPSNTHPLRFMFRGDPYVDLVADGQHFHGPAASAFFPLDRLREADLAFDERVRPIFEDGHFIVRYLLGRERPMVGFLDSAKYHYRVRETSTLRTARTDVGRYTAVLEHGYLDVVKRAVAQHGSVPRWLQSQLVFELSGYFTLTDSQAPAGTPTSGPVAETMHRLMAEILGHLHRDVAVPYCAAPVMRTPRILLQHAYRERPWQEEAVLLSPLDQRRQLVRASWFFTGEAPVETFWADGEQIEPLHAKTRAYDFCGRTLLRQRIVWLPADRAIEVWRDGAPSDLVFRRPPLPLHRGLPGWMRWQLNPRSSRVMDQVQEVVAPTPTSREGRKAQQRMHEDKVRERYRDAWVLMDRIHAAGDSAEVLFRHLRREHPDVNAWFVLEKGTPEWRRFSAEGDTDRLVAHGSLQWRLLMANALHLISSHADESVVHPPAITEFTHPQWLNHFLQHGVIKDDISAWLNAKDLATFVTSSAQELASIAGDDTPYVFTTREVVNTGMPRFDRLLRIAEQSPRDLLLVAPTWRNGLIPKAAMDNQRREADLAVLGSEFWQQWRSFLCDDALAEACVSAGVRVGFLPHPNLQSLLPHLDLPGHVEPLTYEGHDVQEYFARSRAIVTDFSSIAFNAAYLERPVVYFQFDEDVVLEGGHVGRRGYFDYRRDGFGPVETSAAAAVKATGEALRHGLTPEYRARVATTFPVRDGGCSERVVQHIRSTTRHYGAPVPTPVMP
ncbi:glycosyltransferase [Nocardioides mangrovicus]|uniref:Glycosyltransferase n=1 Tax=Nocardioides mangrovicus TaxID=2478913 RepID=A0A3L8P7V4_9ACTN|nr:glycosyltransferase [Nocardioides mangrovicus]RLV50458.1 glycosyltransferase [Nocardioides mangrovicus]